MKAEVNPRPKNITLQEYMTSHSLRKKLTSRSNSRDRKSQLTDTATKNAQTPLPSLLRLSKEDLLQEIKLQMRAFIPKDSQLVVLLKMFERLVQLFNLELEERHRERDMLQTILKENLTISRSVNRTTRQFADYLTSNQGERSQRKQSVEINPKNSACKISVEERPINLTSLGNHFRSVSGTSSESIPNINVLIVSKHAEGLELRDQETKQSIFEQSNDKYFARNDSRHSISFSDDVSENPKETLPIPTAAPPRSSHFTPQASQNQSLIRVSLNASSNRSDVSQVLNRFQDFRKRKLG